MKVILLEKIAGLGEAGALVEVAGGHGRNYLVPQKLALPANPSNLKSLAQTRATIAKKQSRRLSEAAALAKQLEASPLQLTAKAGEEGRLHGSITTQDIAEALAAKGIEIDRRKIHLEEPIKVVGSHLVKVKLGELEATLALEVVAEQATE